ncbi:LOW QUALITY PROTEIN: laminin subunit beta-2-like, partial [Rhinoraja longicauda]
PLPRYVLLPQPVCLERGVTYTLRLHFERHAARERVPNASILLDSIVLVPRYSSLEMFIAGDIASIARKETFERYHCHGNSIILGSPATPQLCQPLIDSMAALVYNGAQPCRCDPQGSVSSECRPRGGQCQCKANVMGRRCSSCSPGTFGFGPAGCRGKGHRRGCRCDPEGSMGPQCDQASGQCQCRSGAFGSQCGQCQGGHWGFPTCRLCQCHGHTEECEPRTGACQGCRHHTSGTHCQQCAPGYHGNPELGTGGQCRPCPCPVGPGSDRNFATSCRLDGQSRQLVCECHAGYTGPRCQECAPRLLWKPLVAGGRCAPCQCHGNVAAGDPRACDRETGRCLRCLYHTEGAQCQLCRRGYHGDARRHSCRKCTCNMLGTASSHCLPQEGCECDRTTGQCPCLPSVTSQNCDRCAPDHWNLAGGSGCQLCHCAATNAFSATCNEVSGQCQCRPGFGGRTCTDCQENHWGDPNVQCRVCDCDERGVWSGQCDRATGHCACRPGVSGVRCDACARGFSGEFPVCQVCHACFGDWDRLVQDLAAQTRDLARRAADIRLSGISALYDKNFRELEEKLRRAQHIVSARNTTAAAIAGLMQLINELRERVSGMTDTLDELEWTLTAVQEQNGRASVELRHLDRDTLALNMSARYLGRQLDKLRHANFLGAYDSISHSYRRSWQAEWAVNASTLAVPSTVSESLGTRRRAELLLRARKDDFHRKNAANRRALNDLSAKVQTLSLENVNEKVCGFPGDLPCADSPCGGAGCYEDDGTRHCGGLNCNGAVAVADTALERAWQSEQEIQQAMSEVEELFKKVAEAKVRANEAKRKAQGTLDKANDAKERISHSNKELRDLIRQIRDFLTQEGADPDSIEKVATQVMNIHIPADPQQIRHLAEEIKDRVSSLSNVDDILDQTADDVRKAGELLQDARRARGRAENVKQMAEAVKRALEEAGRAQAAADTTVQQAQGDIEDSEQALNRIRVETASAEQELMKAMDQLAQLDGRIDALRMKRANNSLVATRARDTAGLARDKANEAKQMLDGLLTDKYSTAHGLIDRKSSTVFNAKHKAESLRDEAKDLLRDAQDKLERLNDLEYLYKDNEKVLEGKARQLDGLEEKMKEILKAINQQIQIYNTCQ